VKRGIYEGRDTPIMRWTPSFGQPGSGVKVDSMGFVRLPFVVGCILEWSYPGLVDIPILG